MADFRLQGLLEFNTDSFSRGIQKSVKELDGFSRDVKKLGRELNDVGQEFGRVGAVITGSFTAAILKARGELPGLDKSMDSLGESLQSVSNSIGKAVAPSVERFAGTMASLADRFADFAAQNAQLIQNILKFGLALTLFGAITAAVNSVLKVFSSLIGAAIQLGTVLSGLLHPAIILVVGALTSMAAMIDFLTDKTLTFFEKLQIFASSGFVGIGAFVGQKRGQSLSAAIDEAKKKFKELLDSLEGNTKGTALRLSDLANSFFSGLRSQVKSLSEDMKAFGAAVGQALEKGLGDTIFNLINGNLKDLKSILLSFVTDLERAFSQFVARRILDRLFDFIPIFGRPRQAGGGGNRTLNQQVNNTTINNFDRQLDRTGDKFRDLRSNMDLFARAKDNVIDRLRAFGRGLSQAGGGALGGGAIAGPAGQVANLTSGLGDGISDKVIESVEAFNETITITQGLVDGIVGGWRNMQKETIKQGIVFAAVTAGMLAVSAVAAGISVAIGTAAAAALAAAWVVPAILASIATFGVAAAVGTAAVAGAMSSAGGVVAIGVQSGQAGKSAFGGNIEFGNFGGGEVGVGAEGGIVTRPTLAVIGEAGPEAVVPLNKTRGNSPLPSGGGHNVNISIDKAVLNDPSDMDRFMRRLREELARA